MTPGINNAIGPQVRATRSRNAWLMGGLALLVLLCSLSAATQYFAHAFQYHATLGLHAGNLYLPWMILVWAADWGSHYPSQFTGAGSVGIMVAAFGLLLLLALNKHLSESGTRPSLFARLRALGR